MVAIGRAVKTKDVRGRLLILKFEEESVRDSDAPLGQASSVAHRAWRRPRDLANPESKSAGIRRATEKVVIVLTNKVRRIVERIRSRIPVVVVVIYREHRLVRRTEVSPYRVAQREIYSLSLLGITVINDDYIEKLRDLSGRKCHRA